jgi:hypothetical protein
MSDQSPASGRPRKLKSRRRSLPQPVRDLSLRNRRGDKTQLEPFIAGVRGWEAFGCSQPETPDVCDSRWRTLIPALPLAANSGQYEATVASRSSWPRSTSTRAASEVMDLVVEKTLVIVFSVHGTGREPAVGRTIGVDDPSAAVASLD